jgi:hypothetical protein
MNTRRGLSSSTRGKNEDLPFNLPIPLVHFCCSLFCEKAGLWPGRKGVTRKKHRPRHFGFFWFSFSIHIPQSAFRNLEAGLSGATQFGIRNVEFGISWFHFAIPHSALYIPHFHCSPGPRNEMRLMVFARNALPSGPQAFFPQKRTKVKGGHPFWDWKKRGPSAKIPP